MKHFELDVIDGKPLVDQRRDTNNIRYVSLCVLLACWILMFVIQLMFGCDPVDIVANFSADAPFLFEIFFTFMYPQFFELNLQRNTIIITIIVISCQSVIMFVPSYFYGETSLLYFFQNVASIIVNLNCSLTLVKMVYLIREMKDCLVLEKIEISDITDWRKLRNPTAVIVNFQLQNLKNNETKHLMIKTYLSRRLFWTSPFFLVNLLLVFKANFYNSYFTLVCYYLPSNLPFVILSFLITRYNTNLNDWENYYGINTNLIIRIFGYVINDVKFFSLTSFAIIALLKFVLIN
jgi:hypothetical protein